jgi:hypothetical protein
MIPEIDGSSLFDTSAHSTEFVDSEICWAACDVGFMTITGVPKGEERNLGPIDRILSVFSDVRAGEGANVLLMLANIFLILTAYCLKSRKFKQHVQHVR